MSRRVHRGITLVETLVVIGIIGSLISLSLPVIHGARERGRATVCMSNLRQIALASLAHEGTHGHLPSGGWGGAWVGVPGRGAGPQQPGGWVYTLLASLDRRDLAEFGLSASPEEREAGMARLIQIPLTVLNCPTRRRPVTYPVYYEYARRPHGSAPVQQVARGDYAMNCGDQTVCDFNTFFPQTLVEGDNSAYPWPKLTRLTGVSFLRSRISLGAVRDGAGSTYLVGEKYVPRPDYENGVDKGDDWSMYSGFQNDTHRSTSVPPLRDGREAGGCHFGSAHPDVWHAAFCDGAVRPLRYEIGAAVHAALGHRADGMPEGDEWMR